MQRPRSLTLLALVCALQLAAPSAARKVTPVQT
jgi:hypothetical protein